MTATSCEDFSESAPELALGVLTGEERARALKHLDICIACRSRLDRLVEVSEVLVELVTPVDPPLGFEVRVAARLAPPQSPGRLRHRIVRAAAVAALALAAGLGGWVVATRDHSPAPSPLLSSPLEAGTHPAGRIFLHSKAPSWVYMTIDVGGGDEPVTCELHTASGRTVRIGTFTLVNGYGYWAAPLPPGTGEVRIARLVTANGTVVAEARFRGA